MPPRRRRLILIALLLIGTPLVLEAVVRVRAYAKYGPYDDIYALYEGHPAGMLMARPGLDVNFGRRAHIQTDTRGFRSPELPSPKPPGTLRLAFLGGSTTFCGEARSNQSTWPSLLTEGLAAAHPTLRFDYANASVTGASLATSRLCLAHRLPEVTPDVIVIVHAAKDLADDTRALAIAAGLFAPPERSWLERRSKLWMLVAKNLRYGASQSAGRGEGPKLDYDAEALAAEFQVRLEQLVREAQELAPLVVLATYPIKTRADQPAQVQLDNLAQAFTFTPYLAPAGVLQGYAAYNRAIEAVASSTGALLVARHGDVPGTDEYFSDSVHLTERGYEAMAARFLAALEAAPAFARLLTSVEAAAR